MGIIAISGMMPRVILDGSDVEQVARMQVIVAFIIAASNALSCNIATYLVLRVCINSEDSIRSEHIDTCPHVLHHVSSDGVQAVVSTVGHAWVFAISGLDRLLGEMGFGSSSNANALFERTRLVN